VTNLGKQVVMNS